MKNKENNTAAIAESKQEFEAPVVEIVVFSTDDVITASPNGAKDYSFGGMDDCLYHD